MLQGVQSTVETAPNEAIHLCWKQSLINSAYLQFDRYGKGLSREPYHNDFISTRLPQFGIPYIYSFILWHGKGLRREPWPQEWPHYLRPGVIYVRLFRKTFNFFAIFIEEIYFRSLFQI